MKTEADLRSGGGTWLAVTVSVCGSPRSLALRGWVPAGLLAFGLALAAWYLGATLYFVFHDQLLAGLMAKQASAQYAYEDRIAGLSMRLDQQTSRALMDRRTLETSVRDLQERSAQLAARAALIDQLVAHQSAPAVVNGASARPAAGVGFETAPLRLGERAAPSGSSKRAEIDPVSVEQTVAADLSRAEEDQDHALAALRDPALRLVARLKAALTDAGVSPASAADVGGPFVPLPGSAMTFEDSAALLRDTQRQAEQLSALADRVPLRPPVTGTLEVTSTFGPRLDPFLGRPAMHTGVDFREGYGTDVRATAGGTVTLAASEGGYGTMVEINHGGGLVTRYAHLERALVAPGQQVSAGASIGLVGSTGRATGPHLHYETRVNGEPVDPARFLKAGTRLFGAS